VCEAICRRLATLLVLMLEVVATDLVSHQPECSTRELAVGPLFPLWTPGMLHNPLPIARRVACCDKLIVQSLYGMQPRGHDCPFRRAYGPG
jgi:hypothetical protein